MNLSVIILAAGAGTRMRSSRPKVLHKIAGLPMVEHVYNTSRELGAKNIHVVYGHGGDMLQQECEHFDVQWALQTEQLGTAHAVEQASVKVDPEDIALVLYGDVPLITADTLKRLINNVKADDIALLTVELDDPTGYGRIVRDPEDNIIAIVEHKDASDEIRNIREVNTGIMAVRAGYLNDCIEQIENKNTQGEYYLTDVIALAVNDGNHVHATHALNQYEVEGVNDRKQLATLERVHQHNIATQLLTDGVMLADPARIDVRGKLVAGSDSFIDINCVFEGEVSLGNNVCVGPGCIISNSRISDNVVIKPYSVIEDAELEAGSDAGPFARLRPGTVLKENSRVGNFVEVKNTVLGVGSKANHLTYLGDSDIGDNVNIGAGTITCNYDGANKHKTVIKDGAFIGSDTQLVAPVTVGMNATVGAGSTITKDIDDETLTLSRITQKSISGWSRPKKRT